MFVYFMVVNHLRTRRDMELFLWAMLVTCVIASLTGIAQIPGGGRITAPFEGDQGEPNTFGGYLVFMVALASGLLANTASLRRRLGLGLVIVLALVPCCTRVRADRTSGGGRGGHARDAHAAQGWPWARGAGARVPCCCGAGHRAQRVEVTFEQGPLRAEWRDSHGREDRHVSSER